MPRSSAVDAYIASAPSYAQPILRRLRELFHEVCPQVDEAVKWKMPYFVYNGNLAGMAANKQHVNLYFWNGRRMRDPAGLFPAKRSEMSPIRLHEGAELPSDEVLRGYILEALDLAEPGAKPPVRKKTATKELPVPGDLAAALEASESAETVFAGFTAGQRRDYIEWITSAKRRETRQRRLAQAVEWIADGKRRNWKYER